jgi:hypothetical protein
LLYEIHRNGIPRLLGNGELFEETIGLVTLWLASHTSGAGLAILLDEGSDTWPSVISSDQLQGLVDPEVSREDVVVLVLKDAKSKVLSHRNISSVVKLEEALGVGGPSRIIT